MTVHKRFFVICATDAFPGLSYGRDGFRSGVFVGWDYSTSMDNGPYDERVSRVRPSTVQNARWFSTKVEAQQFIDQHLYNRPVEILHLSLSSV